nr:uncharacterized protein LOC111772985 [Equus caballus]
MEEEGCPQSPAPGLQRDPVRESPSLGARPGEGEATAATSTALPLGQEARVRPGPPTSPSRARTTTDPRPGGGGRGPLGSAPPTRKGAGAAAGAAGGLRRSRGRTRAAPVDAIPPRGLDGDPKTRASGATRGSLLPTPLCIHGGGEGHREARDPSEITRGGGRGPGRSAGFPLALSSEAPGRGRAAVRTGEGGCPTGLRAWVTPGPNLSGDIRREWTSPARGKQRPSICLHCPPPQPLACVEPLPQDWPQGRPSPRTAKLQQQISRFLSSAPADGGFGGSSQTPLPPGSPLDSITCGRLHPRRPPGLGTRNPGATLVPLN